MELSCDWHPSLLSVVSPLTFITLWEFTRCDKDAQASRPHALTPPVSVILS
jgi:hypothetical protein